MGRTRTCDIPQLIMPLRSSPDLQLGDDGLLIDGKTGKVVNSLGATRFDVKVRPAGG